MRLITHRFVALAAAVVCIVGLGACDSGEDSSVLDVDGEWTSEAFQNRDLGQAVLAVTFVQEGENLSGTGELQLIQAGIEMTFELEGTARARSVQFQIIYPTAAPENVNCTRESDARLKCTKNTDRFNLDRNEA